MRHRWPRRHLSNRYQRRWNHWSGHRSSVSSSAATNKNSQFQSSIPNFRRFQLFSVNASATVSNPFNKYLQALRYANGVYDIATARDGSFANFVAVERVTQISRTSVLYCADGSEVRIVFLVNIPDLNNNAVRQNHIRQSSIISYNFTFSLNSTKPATPLPSNCRSLVPETTRISRETLSWAIGTWNLRMRMSTLPPAIGTLSLQSRDCGRMTSLCLISE